MNQESIFIPFFGLMLLTIVVWFYMYYLRLGYFSRQKIDPQSLTTTRNLLEIVPEKINYPSENLLNLFELPVLFYATCLYLYVTHQVDSTNLLLAYAYLFTRAWHSLVHCTVNRVMHRFVIYIISSFVLWVMIIRSFISAIVN